MWEFHSMYKFQQSAELMALTLRRIDPNYSFKVTRSHGDKYPFAIWQIKTAFA